MDSGGHRGSIKFRDSYNPSVIGKQLDGDTRHKTRLTHTYDYRQWRVAQLVVLWLGDWALAYVIGFNLFGLLSFIIRFDIILFWISIYFCKVADFTSSLSLLFFSFLLSFFGFFLASSFFLLLFLNFFVPHHNYGTINGMIKKLPSQGWN